MLYACPVPDLGADPFVERLRDALGLLRIAYLATHDGPERIALKKAGDAVSGAIDVAMSRRREKELGLRLRRARQALREAAEAARAPGTGMLLWGAVARMPRMRGWYR